MKLLDAINMILPNLGESPITAIDPRHPTVFLIVSTIDRVRKRLIAEGWWFNEEIRVLRPDPEGYIQTPANTIAIYSTGEDRLESRGELMYNLAEGSDVFPTGSEYEVKLIIDLPFEQLPHYAADYVQYAACAQAYTIDFGVERTVSVFQQEADRAYILLEQEEIRKRHYKCKLKGLSEIDAALRA